MPDGDRGGLGRGGSPVSQAGPATGATPIGGPGGTGGARIGPPVGAGVAGAAIGPGGAIGPFGPTGAMIAVPALLPAVVTPLAGPGEIPLGRPISPIFNIGGAPIAVFGGVFSGGMPLGGPVAQVFRGGSAPMPPELFVATVSPSGPIGTFFLGSRGSPIGVPAFGGGGLPIAAAQALAPAIGGLPAPGAGPGGRPIGG